MVPHEQLAAGWGPPLRPGNKRPILAPPNLFLRQPYSIKRHKKDTRGLRDLLQAIKTRKEKKVSILI